MVEVRLDNVTKRFGDIEAAKDVSFEVREGQILTLLGPSGCGKSTTLRLIAGFYYPDEGGIYFGDKDVTMVSPQDRNTAMVFQNYALWPHMSVRDNVAYGLKLRDVPREEQNRRITEALERVSMEQYIDRMPNKLSGGQQQRVAVARCLVVNPDVLLMDEPLSNLDAKLRIETRREIRDLVKELGLTAIYVTHDQEEALSISDFITVMDLGVIRQRGTPIEIWEKPANAFVGTFIGEANLLEMTVTSANGNSGELQIPKVERTLKSDYGIDLEVGKEARIVIRPNRIKILTEDNPSLNIIPCRIRSTMYFGTFEHVTARLSNGADIIIYRDDISVQLRRGQQVYLEVKSSNVLSFGPTSY